MPRAASRHQATHHVIELERLLLIPEHILPLLRQAGDTCTAVELAESSTLVSRLLNIL
jgi:hypothetical protein